MRNTLILCYFTLLVLLIAQSCPGDIVLTFDQSGAVNGTHLDQAYGDRVVASPDSNGHQYDIIAGAGYGLAPNIELSYAPVPDTFPPSIWSTGYGNLSTVAYMANRAEQNFEIVLTADSGFQAGLFGFDAAAFGPDQMIDGIEIRDGDGAVLWSSGMTTIFGGTSHSSFDFVDGLFAETLIIDVDLTAVASDFIGIDNIHFAQRLATVVPEPGTATLACLGIGMLVLPRRRRGSRPVR